MIVRALPFFFILISGLLHGQADLTPDVAAPFSRSGGGYLCLPPGARCYVGVATYSVAVPDWAQRMDIRVEIDSESASVYGAMSFGTMPVKASSGAEYVGDSVLTTPPPGGVSTTTLVRNGATGLRTGTQFMALYSLLPFDRASGRVTVTFSREIGVFLETVTDAASYKPYLQVCPGEIVILRGIALGPEQIAVNQPNAGKFPKDVGGTRVLFNGMPAALLYTTATQVAAVAPHWLTPGEGARIQVEYKGAASNVLAVSVESHVPSVFTQDSTGKGAAAALNQDGTPNGPKNPAKRGSYLSIFGSGFGQASIPFEEGQVIFPERLPKMLEELAVRIGGFDCEVQYAGGVPGMIFGLTQINVKVPEWVGNGAQTLWMKVGNLWGSAHYIQDGVVVYVEPR